MLSAVIRGPLVVLAKGGGGQGGSRQGGSGQSRSGSGRKGGSQDVEPMSREAARRIQSAEAKANGGRTPKGGFAARAQAAAARNEGKQPAEGRGCGKGRSAAAATLATPSRLHSLVLAFWEHTATYEKRLWAAEYHKLKVALLEASSCTPYLVGCMGRTLSRPSF